MRRSFTRTLLAVLLAIFSVTSTSVAANAAIFGNRGTDLQQGQYIRAGGNLAYCSLTITQGNIGYTAGHCSGGEWHVGTIIQSKEGRAIGRITAMKPGFDVIKIKLNPSLTVDGTYPKRAFDTLVPGESLYVRGLARTYPAAQFVDAPLIDWLEYKNVAAMMAPLTTEEGTSGGATLDMNDNVVGVNVGTVYEIAADGTQNNYKGTFIPWHIVDSVLG